MMSFLNNQINNYAQIIVENSDKADNAALGQLKFYIALKNAVKTSKDANVSKHEAASLEELGMADALADTLIQMGLITSKEELLSTF